VASVSFLIEFFGILVTMLMRIGAIVLFFLVRREVLRRNEATILAIPEPRPQVILANGQVLTTVQGIASEIASPSASSAGLRERKNMKTPNQIEENNTKNLKTENHSNKIGTSLTEEMFGEIHFTDGEED
jgi:hypothetical protein